ncbi:hypothetical protein K3V53_14720, partial [Listeria monocytogenes]|nr:hypothetical protein [Listeria monocytogenes]
NEFSSAYNTDFASYFLNVKHLAGLSKKNFLTNFYPSKPFSFASSIKRGTHFLAMYSRPGP